MLSPIKPLPHRDSVSPLHFQPTSFLSLEPLIVMQLHSTFAKFDGTKDNVVIIIFYMSINHICFAAGLYSNSFSEEFIW
jgi:hypothetical protein